MISFQKSSVCPVRYFCFVSIAKFVIRERGSKEAEEEAKSNVIFKVIKDYIPGEKVFSVRERRRIGRRKHLSP